MPCVQSSRRHWRPVRKPDIPPWLSSFGRRRGRTLTPHRQGLVDNLLPRIAINPEAPDIASYERIWLEIGFGGGEHLAAQAAKNPDVLFLGCEPFMDGVGKLLCDVEEQKLDNVRILTDDARLLLQTLPPASLERAFILFPDPWPKERHHKRRIVNQQTLSMLARVLKLGSELRIATDHVDYATWILEHAIAHPDFAWKPTSQKDWREAPEDWVQTRYEKKTRDQGRASLYYRLIR